MNREQMIKRASDVLARERVMSEPDDDIARAAAVVDAIIPVAATPAERDALPVGTVVRSAGGTIASRFDKDRGVVFGMSHPFPWRTLQLPLTVVWQP